MPDTKFKLRFEKILNFWNKYMFELNILKPDETRTRKWVNFYFRKGCCLSGLSFENFLVLWIFYTFMHQTHSKIWYKFPEFVQGRKKILFFGPWDTYISKLHYWQRPTMNTLFEKKMLKGQLKRVIFLTEFFLSLCRKSFGLKPILYSKLH